MNGNSDRSEVRLLQLLADRATEGLEPRAASELARMAAVGSHYDESYFEQAAAAIDLAMMPGVSETLPGALRDRILLDARRFFEAGEE